MVSTSDNPTLGVSLSAARQVILVANSNMIVKIVMDNFFISSPFLSFCSTVNVLVFCVCGLFLVFASGGTENGNLKTEWAELIPILPL